MPDEPFQQSKTHVSLKDKEIKRSANIYENSGSWFSGTTTGIQSGSKIYKEPRPVITFILDYHMSHMDIMWFQISSRRENK